MKTANKIFTIFVLLSLALPPLGLLGLRSFAKIKGFDRRAQRPAASARAFLDGAYQREFAAWHERRMFGRNELLLLKNGIFDIANFGGYHSGYDGRVVQGADGVLFEKSYIHVRLFPPKNCRKPEYAERFAQTAETLRQTLAERGIAFGLALAPSKADICSAQIPARFRYFASAYDGFDIYDTLSAALEKRGVPFVNGNKICEPYKDTDIAFPYSGIHWTVWAAALAATDLIPRINERSGANLPVPLLSGMRYENTPFTDTDRDIAGLLNLPWRYRRKNTPERYAHVDFGELPTNNTARVMLFGDSFCNQFKKALIGSGGYPRKQIKEYSNRLPTQEKLDRIAANVDVFFIVYTSGSFAQNRAINEMEHLTRMLRQSNRAAE